MKLRCLDCSALVDKSRGQKRCKPCALEANRAQMREYAGKWYGCKVKLPRIKKEFFGRFTGPIPG